MITIVDAYASIDEVAMQYEAGVITAEDAMSNIISIIAVYEEDN